METYTGVETKLELQLSYYTDRPPSSRGKSPVNPMDRKLASLCNSVKQRTQNMYKYYNGLFVRMTYMK